jgi:rhodanese-related sulfurtransferase
LNKQNLSYFATILIVPLMFSQIVIAAEDSNQTNQYKNVTANEAYKLFLKNEFDPSYRLFILDVRTPAEYNYTHVKGAKLMPLKNVPSHDPINLSNEELLEWNIKNNKDLPKNKCTKILVYCLSGKRGAIASKMLMDSGYKRVYNMQGGITEWVNVGYPVVVDHKFWAANYPKVV